MKKKRRLKKWVKNLLKRSLIAIVLIGIFTINSNLEKDFISNCESKGYSTNYCIAHS